MDIKVREEGHGRRATHPGQIPTRGWKDIVIRTREQIGEDNLSIVAAGVAFYAFLALFPGIAALVSILGLVVDPADVEGYVESAQGILPPDALTLVRDQVHAITSAPSQALGLGLVISVGAALWSATAGVKALMEALNIVYEERERRGFLRYYWTALWLTLGTVVFGLLALALVAALPAVLEQLALPRFLELALGLVRWVVLGGAFVLALAVLYRFAPSREQPKWRWVSWGAAAATLLWLAGSGLFSLYVANFGDYNKTYGALAAIVILLTWFYLTAFVVLLGAELNAEMEHQTREDSTVGHPKPMGDRGARMADSVGGAR
jgi:membrane protein